VVGPAGGGGCEGWWGEDGGEGFFAEEDQPVPAVGVGEGVAGGHFGDVLWGVELGMQVSDLGVGVRDYGGLTVSPSRYGRPWVAWRCSATDVLPQPAGPVITHICFVSCLG